MTSGAGSAHTTVDFRRYGGAQAREIRDVVQSVYERSYVEAIDSGDPFDSVPEFMRRFDAYASNPALDLVIAFDAAGVPVGQSWGWPLTARTAWWSGLLTEPNAQFTDEDGTRTFALSEIMVVQEHAGRGIARSLHDTLLAARPESRATLLVEPDNARAYRAYLHWGWTKVAELRPGWPDAPTFDVLVIELG